MPSSVSTSVRTSGDSVIVPLAVRCGCAIGTLTARTRSSRIFNGALFMHFPSLGCGTSNAGSHGTDRMVGIHGLHVNPSADIPLFESIERSRRRRREISATTSCVIILVGLTDSSRFALVRSLREHLHSGDIALDAKREISAQPGAHI